MTVLALISIATGCASQDASVCAFDSAETAMDVDLEASRCFESALAFEDAACAADADCTLIDPSIDCVDSHFGRCPRAVAASRVDAWSAAADDAAAVVCAEAPAGFRSASCAAATARCVESRCTATSDP